MITGFNLFYLTITIGIFLTFDYVWRKDEYVKQYKHLIPEKIWYISLIILSLFWIITVPSLLLAKNFEE